MAHQLMFALESDEKSRSDYMYIKSVLNKWYNLNSRNDVKVSPVFMRGKGNYNKSGVIKRIKELIKNYRMTGDSQVIYCFDTDKYENNPNDSKLLSDAEEYCRHNGYEFVWFCHDIEEVFLGKTVPKSEKTAAAKRYLMINGINDVCEDSLSAKKIAPKKSNLLTVLRRLFEE